jgi:hypothetical protein
MGARARRLRTLITAGVIPAGLLLTACAAPPASPSAGGTPPYEQTGGAATSQPWTGDGPQTPSRAWYLAGFQFGQDDEPGMPATMAVPECDSQLGTNPDAAPAADSQAWWAGCVAGEETELNATPNATAS